MAFIETPRLPDEISAWARGGPEFQTVIGMAGGGFETRNAVWQYPLGKWDIGQAARTIQNAQATIAFHRACQGRATGFRMRDPLDNADNGAGILNTTGNGNGTPTATLYKKYAIGSSTPLRRIWKPVASGLSILRGGSAMASGSGAGQASVDATTGIVTFGADSSAGVTAVAVGATTQVTLAAVLPQLGVNDALYLNGLTGADAGLLNGLASTITAIVGQTYTLSVNTTGKAINPAGSGYAYPQARENLTWTGSFDTPVRFDVDWLQISVDPAGLMAYDSVILRELRDPTR